MNPIEMLKGITNPKQFVTNMIKQNSNPMFTNLLQMGQSGNSKGIEDFARNLCKDRGIDFDKEFAKFMQQIKG